MANQFGHYPKIYVNNKSELFPLIEKYYGKSVNGMNHGQVVKIYLHFLKNNPNFVSEVDALAVKKYGKGAYKNSVDTIVTGITEVVGSIFGSKSQSEKTDQLFYETVMAQQGKGDVAKILIVSVVALAFIGIGVFMVFKLKK
jgi:hypothetical protein